MNIAGQPLQQLTMLVGADDMMPYESVQFVDDLLFRERRVKQRQDGQARGDLSGRLPGGL